MYILQKDIDYLIPHQHVRANHIFFDEIARQLEKGQSKLKPSLEWVHLPDQVGELAESLGVFAECLDEFSEVGAENTISSTTVLLAEIQVNSKHRHM